MSTESFEIVTGAEEPELPAAEATLAPPAEEPDIELALVADPLVPPPVETLPPSAIVTAVTMPAAGAATVALSRSFLASA
jgi:hypothetical protein